MDQWVETKSTFWAHLEKREIPESFQMAERLVQLAIAPEQVVELPEIWWQVGKWCVWDSHLGLAETALRKSLHYNPNRLEAWSELVNTLYYSGKLDDAEAAALDMQAVRLRIAKSKGIDLESTVYFPSRWTVAIGHLAALGWWVKAKELGLLGPIQMKLVCLPERIANRPLFDLLAPFFELVEDPVQIQAIETDSLIYQDSPFLMRTALGYKSAYRLISLIEKLWFEQGRPPLLSLPSAVLALGDETLKDSGVDPARSRVCLHVRESGTYGQTGTAHAHIRNANIFDYQRASQMLDSENVLVFRMGDSKMSRVDFGKNFIDYAHSDLKSPEMDIYLFATCGWMISTPSGPAAIPHLFGKRTLHTNWSPLGNVHPFPGDMFLPRRVWSTSNDRFLGAEEILERQIGWGENSAILAAGLYKIIPNSEAEIFEAATFMLSAVQSGKILAATEALEKAFTDRGFHFVPPIVPSFSLVDGSVALHFSNRRTEDSPEK